ncbi:hypothetical protein ACIRRA_31800 [Nocardia sp. NPDC101769]|uniref:hypothetical protein n=1 Tax=Nocardia sp. NPDC101769 TaxID=3364333 RepID=UPI0038142B49
MTDERAIAVVPRLRELDALRRCRWIRHHRYGPIEFLLRTITYGPKRLRPSPSTVEP